MLYHVIIFFLTDRSIDRFIYSSIYLLKVLGSVYLFDCFLGLTSRLTMFQSFWDGFLG